MKRAGRTTIAGRVNEVRKRRAVSMIIALCAFVCALVFTGCECCGGTGDPLEIPITVSITAPANMFGGEDANWSASWTGGTEPYTAVWDFGGGANPDSVSATVDTMSHATTVNMLNDSITDDADYTVMLTVTDALGKTGVGTLDYVVGPVMVPPPLIGSGIYTEPVLVVTVSDPDDSLSITVDVTVPPGLTVDATSKVASQTGPRTATFRWGAEDVFAGGSGTTTITASSSEGAQSTTTANIIISPIELADDTIYAIPMQRTAQMGDTVTIVVATGAPANAFQYLVGANVTYPTWVHYAPDSFDIGSPGSLLDDADGIWGPAGMGLADGSFLDPIDNFMFGPFEKDDFGIADRHRGEFTVVPLGGSDITGVSGVLFNFGVEFDQAGTATFGFIESQPPINRTYYRDGSNNDYYWGTLAAGPDGVNTTSVNNEIVVTE